MKFFVIEDIKAEDCLAHLFNRYVGKLRLLDAIALPRETMRELRELEESLHAAEAAENEEVTQYLFRRSHFYSLSVLGNSLHNFHWAVTNVIDTLEAFFGEFQGDFHAYAVEQRYRFYKQYGSEDAADYDEAGQVLRKEDAQSLETWGLWHELTEFFHDAGETGRRQEQIGSSGADDFAEFTSLVAQATAFSVPKVFAAVGHEIATAHVNEEGELQVLDLPDRVEAELNQDLRNASLAQAFGAVWDKGRELAEFFRAMNQRDLAAYTTLLQEAKQLLTCQLD